MTKKASILVRLFRQSGSIKEVASEFGVTHQYISLICKEYGLKFYLRAGKRERSKIVADQQIKNKEFEAQAKKEALLKEAQSFSELWISSGRNMAVLASSSGMSEARITKRLAKYRKISPNLFPRSLRRGSIKPQLDSHVTDLKKKCRSVTHILIRAGRLKKTPCEVCSSADVEAHHPDYTIPSLVKWLCRQHHMDAHSIA